MATVYVVSTRTDGTGGFEWRTHEGAALAVLASEKACEAHYNAKGQRYEVRYIGAVEVPSGVDVTDWLDEASELWDFTPTWIEPAK